MTTPPPSSRGSSPLRFFVAVFLLALSLGAIDVFLRTHNAGNTEPAFGASWIWAEGVHRGREPVAFWIVRDIELALHEKAWITIAAQESYVLHVNGRRVGSRLRRGESGEIPTDLYNVSRYSHKGVNRIAVELRSAGGAGGLLAHLRIDSLENVILRSDASWQVYRKQPTGIHATAPLPQGEPPKVWGRPPTGRFRLGPAVERPVLKLDRRPPRTPRRVRYDDSEARWLKVTSRRFRPKSDAQLIYDWGAKVCGLLTFDLAPNSSTEVAIGLLDTSVDQPPEGVSPPADGIILPIPGSDSWQDPKLRCLRYARFRGILPVGDPRILTVPHQWRRRTKILVEEEAKALQGAFGLKPPKPDTPEEDAVRRRLDERSRHAVEK